MAEDFVDKYDFVDPKQAVCPRCGSQVMLVDEEDEIYFCCGKDGESGCKWTGKFCMLNFK